MRNRSWTIIGFCVSCGVSACASGSEPEEPVDRIQYAASVGGCTCPTSGGCSALSYSDVPTDGIFYVTTFGGGTDTQPMSCGGTADGTWAYVADSARFGCKTKLLVEANGKSCVAEVRDCGPNRCVEQAACSCSCGGHFPILDASPFITKYLLGSSGVGWSEKQKVHVSVVDPATPIGCPGGPVPQDSGSGGGAGTGGAAGSSGSGGGAGATSGGGSAGAAGAASGGGGAATGGASGSSGAPATGGSAAKPSEDDTNGGCACRASPRSVDPRGGAAALFALAWAARVGFRRGRRAGAAPS